MGYRSDVGLCLSAKGKKSLDAALAEAEKTNKDFSEIKGLLYNTDSYFTRGDGTVAYHWKYLKLYADYSDVSFIEKLVNDMDDEEYLFIRVGESDDDTEYRGGFWENPLGMCLMRGITFYA